MKKLLLLFLGIGMSSYGSWEAEKYDEYATLQDQIAKSVLKKVTLQGNEKVLDVGCGSGRNVARFAQQVPDGEVVGIDASQEMVTFAQDEYKELENVSFIHLSATDLAYENEFDVVGSFFCLHWIETHEDVLRAMIRALKPGGTLILVITLKRYCPFLKVARETQQREKWTLYFEQKPLKVFHSDINAVLDIVEPAMYVDSCEISQGSWFKDKDHFKRHCLALPMFGSMSDQLKEEYVQEYMQACLDATGQTGDGPIEFIVPRMHLIARKR